ncbi:hypothetical protein [Enterococcus casseliflavus]|uniref:hypothetical protein n=1 Tax=Enterococcus casseliflavus TaxID=37734 RepID=UPI001D165D3B|nr:hypothetical protein [Enterococcus casseliflavus]
MKVEKEEFKRVINNASHLEYNYIHTNTEDMAAYNINEGDIKYLIMNQVHHKLLKHSRKSLLRDKVIIKNEDEDDYKLLKYYVDMLSDKSESVDQTFLE